MKLQIVSDLHLEFKDNKSYFGHHPILIKGDVLIDAGDYKNRDNYSLDEFKSEGDWLSEINIKGNHDYYRRSHIHDEDVSNFVKIIDNIKFICTPLWSYISPVNESAIITTINDFRYIPELSIASINYQHKVCRDFIERELEKDFDGKIVVVTHNLPSRKLISKVFKNNKCNDYFAADCDDIIKKHKDKIDLWIHGHSHEFMDKKIYGVRCVRNPFGYMWEQGTGFKNDFVIEIEGD